MKIVIVVVAIVLLSYFMVLLRTSIGVTVTGPSWAVIIHTAGQNLVGATLTFGAYLLFYKKRGRLPRK